MVGSEAPGVLGKVGTDRDRKEAVACQVFLEISPTPFSHTFNALHHLKHKPVRFRERNETNRKRNIVIAGIRTIKKGFVSGKKLIS